MIDAVLLLLKNKLNSYLKAKVPTEEEKVVFIEGGSMDPIVFPMNTVVPLLINVAEEKLLRSADRYERITASGAKMVVNPSINLNLRVLFICKFSDYKQSLKFLTLTMKFFQQNQVLDCADAPELKGQTGCEKIMLELVTLPMAEQNELWNSLKATYHPSALYKVGVISLHDEKAGETVEPVLEVETKVERLGWD